MLPPTDKILNAFQALDLRLRYEEYGKQGHNIHYPVEQEHAPIHLFDHVRRRDGKCHTEQPVCCKSNGSTYIAGPHGEDFRDVRERQGAPEPVI